MLASVAAAASIAGSTSGAGLAAPTCTSDGVPSDDTYVVVCFSGCKVDESQQFWHVARATFDADVQAIMTAERCSSWAYWDETTQTYVRSSKSKQGKRK